MTGMDAGHERSRRADAKGPRVLRSLVAALGLVATGAASADATRPLHASEADGARSASDVPAVLRDTSLTLRLRSHYVDVETATGVEREAWALGGWLAYRSGWLLDAVQAGATLYGSAPAYAPADKADTLLLAPGKEGYFVVGEAFASVRYREVAAVKAYRQALDLPYINRQDNAMTPNTFEGVAVAGRGGRVEYTAGYLTRMKTRNADEFVPMSEAAGARGSEHGTALAGVKLRLLRALEIDVHEQYGVNTYNTLFVQVEHVSRLCRAVRLQLGAQLTDQRAVGDALVATTRVERWDTQNGSARLALTYGNLTMKVAASVTASGNRIQSPWGFFPGYLRMDQQQFNNAGEKAWLVGADYDFNRILPGLTAFASAGWGIDSIDPVSRASLGDEAEYDLVVAYRPPAIKGLLFRTRGLLYHLDGADRLGDTIRFTINWEIPLLGAAAQPPR